MSSPSGSESLERRMGALEQETASLQSCIDLMRQQQINRRIRWRRRWITAIALASFASLGDSAVAPTDTTLHAVMEQGSIAALPPLDSMVTWARTDTAASPAGHTNEILSMVVDGTEKNSYLWPLYIELRGTTSPAATQSSSQSVGATVRSIVRSRGHPWTAGFHSELAHGREAFTSGRVVRTEGTSILFNGEMRSYGLGGQTIGVNLQCVYTDSSSTGCEHAINIQAGSATTVWQNGIHFDSDGDYETGDAGINFDRSRYKMGIELGNNSLRLNAGQKIFLTSDDSVYLWYDIATKKVEIYRAGEKVAAF